jgi:uncharacterized protein DUF6898
MLSKSLQSQIFFEVYAVGNVVKVSAIDPDSLVEVSVMGPALVSVHHLKNIAERKLINKLNSSALRNPINGSLLR